MITISRTFPVDAAPQIALDYLADFSHAEQWDPGTQHCTRTDTGPITIGATWHNRSRFAGRTVDLDYTLKNRAADTLVFLGHNPTTTSTDTITIHPNQPGSLITYRVDLDLHGPARWLTPLVTVLFHRTANRTEQQMTHVLNTLI